MLHYFIIPCYLICMHVQILCLAVVEIFCGLSSGAGRGPRSWVSGKLMAQDLVAATFLGVVERWISAMPWAFLVGWRLLWPLSRSLCSGCHLPSRVMIDIFANTDSYQILSILWPLLISPLFQPWKRWSFFFHKWQWYGWYTSTGAYYTYGWYRCFPAPPALDASRNRPIPHAVTRYPPIENISTCDSLRKPPV